MAQDNSISPALNPKANANFGPTAVEAKLPDYSKTQAIPKPDQISSQMSGTTSSAQGRDKLTSSLISDVYMITAEAPKGPAQTMSSMSST